ncbi:MAG: 9-O-acetylesterase [Phycisphaera sp.]|nr:9-O-acetylesterase [Phycisphaera sp.]
MLTLMILTLLGAAMTEARAEVKLPGFFSDHMVLQREMKAPVWGWADAGEKVAVTVGDKTLTTTAGADGKWRVEFPPMKAGGPITLTVKGSNTLTVNDVLVGEVWLCSGQSNMEFTVHGSVNAAQEIAAADYPQIRHLKFAHRPAGEPLDDIEAPWQVCSPQTVGNFTACGYFMARELHKELGVPIGLINSSWGGTRVEPWTTRAAFEHNPKLADIAERVAADWGKPPSNHQNPTVLYNGMIHPIVGYAMRGAIWYQGESNHNEGMLYYEKKKALIGGWRDIWGVGAFPFYFVQIAPFQYGNEDPTVMGAFWEAQARCLDIPNTGMVVTSDIATLQNIHPPNKQDVGHRLALLALNRTYGRKCEDSGPVFKEMKIDGDKLVVSFDHADGLKSRDGSALTFFEIADAESGFVPATAEIKGTSVVLTSDKVSKPVAMRFAWNKLAEPNLVNGAGLPTSAFRAGEIPKPDFLPTIAEAKGYTLVYDIDLANLSAHPSYDVDRHAEVKGFDRVAYLLELQPGGGKPKFVFVSLDAFTDDAGKIAIPTVDSGASFQLNTTNMTVVSNFDGIATGNGIAGNIEFWPNNYGPANTANIPNADPAIWDFGDQRVDPVDGYGCMQVHNPGAKQTIFAINQWKAGGGGANIGIGNSSADARTRDWTFVSNGGSYTAKRLRVLVHAK